MQQLFFCFLVFQSAHLYHHRLQSQACQISVQLPTVIRTVAIYIANALQLILYLLLQSKAFLQRLCNNLRQLHFQSSCKLLIGLQHLVRITHRREINVRHSKLFLHPLRQFQPQLINNDIQLGSAGKRQILQTAFAGKLQSHLYAGPLQQLLQS